MSSVAAQCMYTPVSCRPCSRLLFRARSLLSGRRRRWWQMVAGGIGLRGRWVSTGKWAAGVRLEVNKSKGEGEGIKQAKKKKDNERQ